MLSHLELYELLEEKTLQYNNLSFIETDPIQVPKQFAGKENIEIAGFLAASIAWGQRPTIIKNASRLMQLMDNDPYNFLLHSRETDWQHFHPFKHRTFNGTDCLFFIRSLQHIYRNCGGLETLFTQGFSTDNTIASAIRYFRQIFFEVKHEQRSQKHISNIDKGASAKRINMFLRWMVRQDEAGVDLKASHLQLFYCRWMCTPAHKPDNWDCSNAGKTTGKPSGRSPKRYARSTRPIQSNTTLPFLAWARSVNSFPPGIYPFHPFQFFKKSTNIRTTCEPMCSLFVWILENVKFM